MLLKDLKEHEQLSTEDRSLYNDIWQRHPHWTHAKIMTKNSTENRVEY